MKIGCNRDRLAFFIAGRYLFSKKSHSVINLISAVTFLSIVIPAAAMVILLSVSNGFEQFIKSLNSNFDPQITISSSDGKLFHESELDSLIWSLPEIKKVTKYFEADALFALEQRYHFGKIRGIDSAYNKIFPIESSMIDGTFDHDRAIVGGGVAYEIGLAFGIDETIDIYAPKEEQTNFLGINNFFQKSSIPVAGVYTLDAATDGIYVLLPLSFSQALFGKPNKISALGVLTNDSLKIDQIKNKINSRLPEQFIAKDSFEVRESEYRIASSEKRMIFIILLFVAVIASFTMIGTLLIMIIEKGEQNKTLYCIGGTRAFIRRIFIYQGMIITSAGTAVGLFIGVVFCLLQQQYGFIRIQSGVALLDSYPVIISINDLALLSVSMIFIGLLVTIITVKRSTISEWKD